MSCRKLLGKMFLPLLLLLTAQLSFAQDKTITGKVTDSKDGSPVVSASVQVKGSGTGTTTGADGTFRLTVGSVVTTLIISSIGFENQEVSLGGKTEINVGLTSLATGLGEVVVVGYGTQKKREVTSAITTVSAEQFNKGNIPDAAQLLQGKVAGLSVARPGGDPNGGFTIRLRGLSTLGANAGPLVVVDGIVGADLNMIDPNDIKSIDVLKDGSSAAIYGTRGSAGVIIVTTKSGSVREGSQVSYNGSVTFEKGARFTPHMTAGEFRDLIKNTGTGTDFGATTDWNKEITRTAISHVHNLSFSGGTAKTNYLISLNARNNQGIAITTGFEQLNGFGKLTHKAFNNRVVFNIEMASTRKSADYGFSKAFQYATVYNPTAPIYSDDPTYDIAGGGYFEQSSTEYSNPVAMLRQNSNHGEIKKSTFAGSVEIELIKGLKNLTRFAYQNSSNYLTAYTPTNAFIDRGFYDGASGYARHGYAYNKDDESKNKLIENILSYQRRIQDFDFTATAGYSYQDFLYQGFQIGAGNFITDLSHEDISTSQDFLDNKVTKSSYKNGSKLVAFFGRINANYKDFAFVSASLRREGSTQFGLSKKWGNFFAVSGGVDVDKMVELPFFNSLKVRASYGVTGQLPPQSYLSLLTFTGQGNYLINGSWIQTYGPNQNVNPNLGWEKKAETDIGIDFSALKNRFTGTLDYYVRKTNDLIFQGKVPSPPALIDLTWLNVGDMKGSGFEAAFRYDVFEHSKTLQWNTAINFATNKSKLTSLAKTISPIIGQSNLGSPGQEGTQITRAEAGKEIGLFYGPVYKGVDANGLILYDDGKGGTTTKADFLTYIGHGLPNFELGWVNTLSYKNFDFNIFFRGSFGHQIINTERAFFENPTITSTYNVVNTKYFNPAVKSTPAFSSYHVEKGDFVKLDNATIGYNFSVGKNTGISKYISNMRAFVTGYNLFLITGYTGADPEVRYADNANSASPNILAPGIDRRETWVLTRSFTVGLNVTF